MLSMGAVRRRMRSKGPDPALQVIQVEAIHLMIQAFQVLEIVRIIRQVFHFTRAVVHLMMEEMEMAQEKTMMAKSPMIRIRIVSNIDNHPKIQTRVAMVETEDVEDATRLLLRSTSGRSRYLSWTFLPRFISRRRVR